MKASVLYEPDPFRPFLGWCPACQEGVRHGAARRAVEWVGKHNRDKHAGSAS